MTERDWTDYYRSLTVPPRYARAGYSRRQYIALRVNELEHSVEQVRRYEDLPIVLQVECQLRGATASLGHIDAAP